MKYDEEYWLKVYTRDTPSWLALSWQARGLALEIARKLPKLSGELSLGRKGLPALAPLLRAAWAEIEPFVQELIDDGKLVYDAERQVISDPQHAERQGAQTSGAERTRRWRAGKALVTDSHEVAPVTSHGDAVTSHGDQEKRREEKEEIRSMSPFGDGAGEVWDHYVACLKRHRPRRRPGALRPEDRRTLVSLLKTRTVEDVKAACTGLFRSSHHLGVNDRGTEYLALKYALRNLDTMIALADEDEPSPDIPAPHPRDDLVDPADIAAALETLNGIGVA